MTTSAVPISNPTPRAVKCLNLDSESFVESGMHPAKKLPSNMVMLSKSNHMNGFIIEAKLFNNYKECVYTLYFVFCVCNVKEKGGGEVEYQNWLTNKRAEEEREKGERLLSDSVGQMMGKES